jgi:transcriptional regulator with XRE-family HTH domain
MKTGEKISKARRSVNLTQDQLAELLEVTRQTISKWESDLALPEASKIAKLAEVLKVSCDYLLKDCKVMTTEVSMTSENSYAIDWSKLYPVLREYQDTVDCERYNKVFSDMIKDMIKIYNYSIDDAILVLKDLLYKSFLNMKEEEK